MAKPRGAQKNKQQADASPFLEALRFVALAQRESGEPYQTHVILSQNTAVAYDGVLAAGAIITEALEACPHTDLLIKALSRAAGTVAISHESASSLTVRTDSERFKAHVPCLGREIMPTIMPDPPIAPISNEFIRGLERIAGLATENGSHVVTSSILIRRYSMIATDRNMLLEYWHGIDLPTFALPKAAAIALTKCGKELQWFGFSQHSVTFYFTDGTWLRSQLYDGAWPDVDSILFMPKDCNAWPLPQSFIEGVRAVAPFHENGWVTFKMNKLASQLSEGGGAEYTVAGVPGGPVFNAKYLLMLESLAKSVDFVAAPGKAAFFGDNLRGVMIGIVGSGRPTCDKGHAGIKTETGAVQWPNCNHECIPF